MRVLIFVTCILFMAAACKSQNKKQTETPASEEIVEEQFPEFEEDVDYLDEQETLLIGNWESIYLQVDVDTYQGGDTSFVVKVDEHTWDLKMNINPIITSIFSDGNYRSVHTDVYGNILQDTRGAWMLDYDSLVMKDDHGMYQYGMFIDGNIMELKTYIDYDGDGEKDDFYIGRYRRMKKASK